MKKKIYNIFLVLFMGIILMLIVNNLIFLHSHYLSDGTVITHAHPFKKTPASVPYSSHNHSKAELMMLESLQLLFFLFIILFAASVLVKVDFYPAFNSFLYDFKYLSPHPGRAPPLS